MAVAGGQSGTERGDSADRVDQYGDSQRDVAVNDRSGPGRQHFRIGGSALVLDFPLVAAGDGVPPIRRLGQGNSPGRHGLFAR